MNNPDQPWWHELNTTTPENSIAFYERTLGWEFETTSLPDGGCYWIARKDGQPVGGIYAMAGPDYDGLPSHWMTYMVVDDISKAKESTLRAGGQIARPAVSIDGVGKLAMITDSSGALIGLFEPEDTQPAQAKALH